ncbi:MAG: DsrH/TusB family sulfur metabolism protein [Candidatus Odinarchaeota archaeon]
MTCYLVDLPKYKLAFRIIANTSNKESIHLVLIQDGVFIDPSKLPNVKTYAMKPDAEERGAVSRLFNSVKLIGYGELVDLIEKHPVKNFI